MTCEHSSTSVSPPHQHSIFSIFVDPRGTCGGDLVSLSGFDLHFPDFYVLIYTDFHNEVLRASVGSAAWAEPQNPLSAQTHHLAFAGHWGFCPHPACTRTVGSRLCVGLHRMKGTQCGPAPSDSTPGSPLRNAPAWVLAPELLIPRLPQPSPSSPASLSP